MSTRRILAGATLALLLAAAPAQASVDSVAAHGGTSYFTWAGLEATSLIHERSLAGGVLTEPQPLSRSYRQSIAPAIGVDTSGRAVIAWRQSEGSVMVTGLYTRQRTPDTGLTPIQRVSPAGVHVSSFKMDVEPDGDAVYVWERFLNGRGVVQARRRTAAGVLGPIQTVSYAGAHASRPDVAVAPDGAATVAWVRGLSSSYVEGRRIAPDGSLSPLQALTAGSPLPAQAPRVSVDNTGTAVIAWARAAGREQPYVLQSRARSAGGVLGTTQIVSSGSDVDSFTTGGTPSGLAVYAWYETAGDGQRRLVGRIRQADGALGAPFEVRAGTVSGYRVAMDDGDAMFVWGQDDGARTSIHARRRAANGTLGTVQTVSAEGGLHAMDPRLAIDPSGKSTVAWLVPGDGWYGRTFSPVTPGPLLDLSS